MKKSSVAILGILISSTNAIQLQDISLNQRKLFAANHKVYGGEVQIFDQDHVDDEGYEESRIDLRLIKLDEDLRLHNELKKSSLDDPVSDKTVSVVTANSEKENKNRDWLAQKPEAKSNVQLSDVENSEQVMISNDFENEQLYPNELIQQQEMEQTGNKMNSVEQERQDLASTITAMSDTQIAAQEEKENKVQEQKEANILKAKYVQQSVEHGDKYNQDPDHLQDLQIGEAFGGY